MDTLIPSDLLSRPQSLGDYLRSQIIGQAEVIGQISELLEQAFCGMRFPEQPIASILLLGPTGVGKTRLVELLSEHLFGQPEKLIRFDMSEYANASALERLIGNEVGNRGLFGYYYDLAHGSGTLLFDELEKAEGRVLDILLQILSAGRFTLANGETLDLTNFIVTATSNIGARVLMVSRDADREEIVERTETAVEAAMRPETIARFDLLASFNKLDHEALKLIARLHMQKCLDLINRRGHEITVGSGVLEFVQRQGYSEKYGARPIRAAAMRILGGVVKTEMLKNGGQPVCGSIEYNRRANRCFLNGNSTAAGRSLKSI